MTMLNKLKHNGISALCVFLALCIGLLGAVYIIAEAQQEAHYLSDIKLFYASHGDKNAAETAKNKCEAEGYTLLDRDLNSGTGKDWVFIGYKTTTNPDLAITDIRMLGMDRDYYLYDYKEILAYLKNSNAGTAQTLYNASVVFAENYRAGSPKAKDAYEGLNLFYVGDAGIKFGDYVLEGRADTDFFTELVVKASMGTLNAVAGFLNSGIAPFNNADAYARPEDDSGNGEEETSEATLIALPGPEDGTENAEATSEPSSDISGTDAQEITTELPAEPSDAPEAETADPAEPASASEGEETVPAASAAAETQIETAEATTEATTPDAAASVGDRETATDTTVNWATALAADPLWDTVGRNLTTAQKNELHKRYNDDARTLFTSIQDFVTCYENALARNEADTEGASSGTEKTEDKGFSAKEALAQSKDIRMEDGDVLYLAAMETLNQYAMGNGMRLGDWLVGIGLQSSDKVDILQLYPLVDAMGTVQAGLAGNLGFISAVSNLGENKTDDALAGTIRETREAIYQYNKKDCISIWENADDDMDDAYIAYTSDAVRKSSANNSIGQKTKSEIIDEKISEVIQMINLLSGICICACFVAQTAFTIVGSALATSAACATASAVCASVAAGIAMVSAALFWVGIAVLGFTIGYMIGKWIASLIKKEIPKLNHSNFPDYVFDVADTPDGTVTIKYKSVRDENDKVGDLNARQQQKWAILAYTTDKQTGSPVRADSEGNIFKIVYGSSGLQNGYDCVNMFGERSPANANYLTEKNNTDGIYISYRTQRSLQSEPPQTSEETDPDSPQNGQETEIAPAVNYLADIIVATAGNPDVAKAKINKKAGKYYILDYNLSPDTDVSTYIGYTMTTDPDKALTDIRIAPYHGTDAVTFGEVQYTFVGHVGVNVGDDSNDTQGDAILKTKDKNAGSPIPADGIHFVRNLSDAKDVWEPVTLFCGLPYNFNTSYHSLDVGGVGSGYSTTSNNTWKHDGVYMFFEPTVKYTGGTKYLAGIYFINGYNVDKTAAMLWAQTKGKFDHLKDKIRSYPNASIYDSNMAASVRISMESGHDNLREYLCYAWTYNPKRAVYDIAAWQGDTYSDTLPYTISKKSSETGGSVSYAACSVICQQAPDTSDISEMPVARVISPNHAVVNGKALLLSHDDYNRELTAGYTRDLPEGFRFGYQKSDFLPLGVYVSGYAFGREPLGIGDVVVCGTKHEGVRADGEITFDLSGEKTLAGDAAAGAFHSVYEIKHPDSLTPVNIAYPEWYTKKDSRKSDSPTYIYLRNAKRAAGKYISGVCVGSFSRELYKRALQGKKEKVEDSEVNRIDSSVNATAMLNAAGACSDEMLCVNLSCKPENAWYNRQIDGKANPSAPGNTPASYIGVSRTDKVSEAVTGILLYQNDSYPTAKKIQIDGAEYYCDSAAAPIIMNGKQFYLYYTRNRGVLSGMPVEEITVDTEPMAAGYMTALCARAGENTTCAMADLPYYIHQRTESREADYYTGLYLGKGSSREAALGELIRQECPRYIDLDLNTAMEADSVYLGYSSGYLDPDADADEIEDALYEAIYDIVITKNLPYQAEGFVNAKNNIYYAPVSDVDLNSGGKADTLYMYYCTPYTSAKYNRQQKKAKTGVVTALPEDVFTAPLSRIAFARYDRVPYNTALAGTDETGSEVMKWEYIMYSDHSARADFTSGSYDIGPGGYVEDNRVTMFAQRSDGSVKPAGEITGGFVSDTMETGTLFIP